MAQSKKKRFYIRTAILTVLVIAIIGTIYVNVTKEKNAVLAVGDQAPDFQLVDMEGNVQRLSDYEGQGVFLNFWGTWCKPCAKEMPYIDKHYQVYKDQGVQTMAVNIAESDFKVNSYTKQYGMTFPVVIDRKKNVMEQYNIGPLPTTFLVSPEGEIIRIIQGEMTEQDVENFMEEIKPL
ncbi:thiol-disulfide oxidoreductase ResA [Chryseomicrobium sp. FSL W7-1435]|uniref:thiol-disulfide oxidoreductase ResA n=1 Tax=Chryseomicrobium sp. FSL W7-1435 TaxID=2921704 RepID=UPI00315AC6EF